MIHRTIKTVCTALLGTCALFSAAIAGDGHHRKNVFQDYGRVIHVEPKYRVVTERVPQRVCDVHRERYRQRHSNHHYHQPQRRVDSVFVGAVIGGAIGNELSRSMNGRSNTGAAIAGAAIGAGLAASHDRNRSSISYHQSHRDHNRGNYNHRNHIQRSHHRSHRKPHCTSTEHVRRVRQKDGYLVTYRFRGQTFRAHTDYHPGDRIPVRVAVTAGL